MRSPSERKLHRFVSQFLCVALLLQVSGAGTVFAAVPKPRLVSQSELEALLAGHPLEERGVLARAGRTLDAARDFLGDAAEPLVRRAEASWQGATGALAWAFEPQPVQVASLWDPPQTVPSGDPPLRVLTDAVGDSAQRQVTPRSFERPPSPPGFAQWAARQGSALGKVSATRPFLKASDVSLFAGFNLASLPNQPPNPDPAVVLAPIAGQYSAVFAYDACDAADPWKLFDPADPAASDLTVLDHKPGFWIDATVPTVLPSDGTQPAVTEIQLCMGWNLIGYPLAQPRPVQSALASIEGKYLRVFGFDLADTVDPWEVFSVGVPEWANDLRLMQSGRGYWLLVTEDTVLDYENVGAAPFIEITSPADVSEVTAPTDVVATIQSNSLDRWTLSYAPSGEPGAVFTEIATGNVPGTGLTLGTFDPTLLLNGIYDLKLEAVDFGGQIVEDVITVMVDGRRKIGNFTLSFVDLEIPLAGLDIKVLRTYDSREKLPKAFGVGWTLEIFQGSYRNNRTPGEGWQILPTLLPCRTIQESQSHLTAIRLAEDEIYRFRLNLFSPAAVIGGCFAQARFDFVEGPLRGATLEILGNSDVIYTNGSDRVIDADTFEPYEPTDVRLTTGDGRIFDFDIAAGVTRVEDLNGNTLDVTPGGITHSGGEGIAFDRDTEGRVIRITDPSDATLDYTYDARGDLISVQDQVGGVTRFGYDDDHRLLDIEDPRGVNAVRNEYNAEGRLVAVIDANGNRTEFSHDLDARREIISDRRGNATISVYDEDGNVTSRIDAAGGTKIFTYDARGNKLSETTAGATATFTYDADGNVLTDTDETGAIRSYTYNGQGQALTIKDPGGATTTSSYDARGNLLTSTDSLGGVQNQQYDSRGNLTSAVDVLGNTRTSVYDGSGRLLEETDPLGATTTYTYDSNGNRLTRTTSRSDASGDVVTMTETSVYDARNRKIRDIDPLGRVEETDYGPAGRVVAKVDKNGNRVAFTYDVQGQRIRTDYPDGTIETATYDAGGNRATTTDRAGLVTAFAYDALNRLITTTVYGADGNVASITDALGQTVTYEYDANGRQIRQVFADGTSMAFGYDARGRKTAETDQGGAQFEYDALARLTAVTDPLGGSSEYAYDEVACAKPTPTAT